MQTVKKMIRLKAAVLFLLASLTTIGLNAQVKHFNNVDANGVILDGYDAVAFFTDNKPVKGDAQFQFKYEDAIYYFATSEHLELFKRWDPLESTCRHASLSIL